MADRQWKTGEKIAAPDCAIPKDMPFLDCFVVSGKLFPYAFRTLFQIAVPVAALVQCDMADFFELTEAQGGVRLDVFIKHVWADETLSREKIKKNHRAGRVPEQWENCFVSVIQIKKGRCRCHQPGAESSRRY